MCILTLRANVLMLEGNTRTLKLAQSHNLRKIPHGGNRIDSSRNHLHVVLVPIVGGKLQADKVRGFKKANIRAMSLFDIS